MPSKSVSAVQRLAQTMRNYSSNNEKNLVKKSRDALSMMLQGQRLWPQREESFAAVQLIRQSRNWNNFRKYGASDMHNNSNSSSSMLARQGPVNRRNNILTSRSATSKRKYMEEASRRRESKHKKLSHSREEENAEADDTVDDTEQEVRSVRDAIFGSRYKSDDYFKLQREADEELRKRVTKPKSTAPEAKLSSKVIAPYNTYRNHRNNWAEFRHRMIYGSSSF